MSVISIALPPGFQRAAEHVQRGARSYWHRGEVAKRRHLAEPIKPKSGLPLIDVRLGYALLPRGTINGVDAAVTFAQALWREQGFSTKRARKSDYRATILAPRTYE